MIDGSPPTHKRTSKKKKQDRRSKPFGCLTQRGLEGMRQLGASLRELHPAVLKPPSPQSSRDGPDPSASSSSEGGSVAAAAAAFQAYSSNFARTQQSAQGLLDGLRGAKEEEELPVVVPVVVREVGRQAAALGRRGMDGLGCVPNLFDP